MNERVSEQAVNLQVKGLNLLFFFFCKTRTLLSSVCGPVAHSESKRNSWQHKHYHSAEAAKSQWTDTKSNGSSSKWKKIKWSLRQQIASHAPVKEKFRLLHILFVHFAQFCFISLEFTCCLFYSTQFYSPIAKSKQLTHTHTQISTTSKRTN